MRKNIFNSCIKWINLNLIWIVIIVNLILISCSEQTEIDYRNWTMYSGYQSGSKYTDLDEINKENVANLEVAWTFKTGDIRESPPSTLQCNPIIIDETMYITSPGLKIMK